MTASSSELTPLPAEVAARPSLDRVYREHAPTIARWAARLAGPNADIEDLVHEIVLVARRRLPEFRGEAKLSTWLYRITERVVRQARRRDRFRHWFAHTRRLEIEEALAPARLTPVDDLERRQSSEACYRILDAMPDK